MNWYYISVVGNIVLLVVIGIFALDRKYFRATCELRHNPIDEAIHEIKDSIKRIWEKLNE